MIHNIVYENLIDPRPLRIILGKIDGFITIYDETTYLIFFGSKKYDAIYDRPRYFVSLKSGITYIFSDKYIFYLTKLILMILCL